MAMAPQIDTLVKYNPGEAAHDNALKTLQSLGLTIPEINERIRAVAQIDMTAMAVSKLSELAGLVDGIPGADGGDIGKRVRTVIALLKLKDAPLREGWAV